MNYKTARPVIDQASATPDRYPVIALQEPGITASRTTYCPRNYQLVISGTTTTRVAFLVAGRITPSQWRAKCYDDYVMTLTLRIVGGRELTIINVYNPIGSETRLEAWGSIRNALRDSRGNPRILLGDFNAHHHKWGGHQVEAEEKAEHLRRATIREGMSLKTPRGIPTWRRGLQSSVIDLTFTSNDISDLVVQCSPMDEWIMEEDHTPILTTIRLRQEAPPTSTRYALKKADWQAIVEHVDNSEWHTEGQPEESLIRLQNAIREAMEKHCPKSQPSPRSIAKWSPELTALVRACREIRKAWTRTEDPFYRSQWKILKSRFRREVRKEATREWRRFLSEFTNKDDNTKNPHNLALWRMSKWSRTKAGKPPEHPHMAPLRGTHSTQTTTDDKQRVELLRQAFFPPPETADLGDIPGAPLAEERLVMMGDVTEESVSKLIRELPNKKAPGPDNTPNEALKELREHSKNDFTAKLTSVMVGCIKKGVMPESYKQSTTITLRKERKPDYTIPKAYRPIALENTLAKLLEKVVAVELAKVAEENGLLPWNQMGGRKHRSTLSAIELVQSVVHTAWAAPGGAGKVVSMLCLDLAGAYDKVSHPRLLHILRRKAIPEDIIKFVESFLKNRKTKIAYTGYTSEWIRTETGIPQGSTISPVLFLFFISELLERLQKPENSTIGVGFVDDTNLITWGKTAKENCERLRAANGLCEEWARRHGAKFEPAKYQLIHFTRARHSEDLSSPVKIGETEIKPESSLKFLGIWMDSKLTWTQQVKKTASKGAASLEAVLLTTATQFGPSMRRTRILYTAVTRPIMMHAAPIWCSHHTKGIYPKEGQVDLLEKVQNRALRRILGAYKHTPIPLLEKDAAIPPIGMYATHLAQQRAWKTSRHPVTRDLQGLLEEMWREFNRQERPTPGAPRPRGRPRIPQLMPTTPAQAARMKTEEVVEEMTQILQHREQSGRRPQRGETGGHQYRWKRSTVLDKHLDMIWRSQWEREKTGRTLIQLRPKAWNTPWGNQTVKLYEGMEKWESKAAFLLRSEVLGLNEWLHWRKLTEEGPGCPCGAPKQTVKHVMIYCPRHSEGRSAMLAEAGSQDLEEILQTPRGLRAAAQWLLRSNLLKEFEGTREGKKDKVEQWRALPQLE
jgi:endonuclease/exonuclease/phosphatase family metal-dependent hydrolase